MASASLTGVAAVEAYLDSVAQPHQGTLRAVRASLRKVLPHADEGMKYGMPSFIIDGTGIAAYCAFKQHCSYFPFSGSVLDATGPLPGGVATTKGTFQFPVDRPLPMATIRILVKVRLQHLPQPANGTRRDYHADGTLKAEGRVKGAVPHGAWRWFRSDGSLMRTGHFRAGEPTGSWSTWARDGRLVKTTEY
ncbi:MAG: hypothetical protein RJA49_407 [Actinomycetota bacterium]